MKIWRGFLFTVICLFVTISCYFLLVIRWMWAKLLGRQIETAVAHEVAGIWGRFIFNLTPGWQAEISGEEHLEPLKNGQARLLVVNHQSNADIMPLYFLGIPFCWLAKEILFRIPMVGQAMKWSGYVAVKRHDKGSREEAMQICRERLQNGVSMVFFPEGTRSVDGQMKDFKLGAFRLAEQCQVEVIPIVMEGVTDLLPKKSFCPGTATIRIQILPSVALKGGESIVEYKDRVRALMLETHQALKAQV